MAFENLLNQYLEAKYTKPEQVTLCQTCGYPLEETDRGIHCPFDGWTPNIPPKFVPQIPDVPK